MRQRLAQRNGIYYGPKNMQGMHRVPSTTVARTGGAMPVVGSLATVAKETFAALKRDPVSYGAFKLLTFMPFASALPDETLADVVRFVRPGFQRPKTAAERNMMKALATRAIPRGVAAMPHTRDYNAQELQAVGMRLPDFTARQANQLRQGVERVFEHEPVVAHLQGKGYTLTQIAQMKRNSIMAIDAGRKYEYAPHLDQMQPALRSQQYSPPDRVRQARERLREQQEKFRKAGQARSSSSFMNNVNAGILRRGAGLLRRR